MVVKSKRRYQRQSLGGNDFASWSCNQLILLFTVNAERQKTANSYFFLDKIHVRTLFLLLLFCLASCNNEYRALEERKLTDIMKQNGCMTVRILRYPGLSVSIAMAVSQLSSRTKPLAHDFAGTMPRFSDPWQVLHIQDLP